VACLHREGKRSVTTIGSPKGRSTQSFEVPVTSTFQGIVQIDITQNDRFASPRTFSYRIE